MVSVNLSVLESERVVLVDTRGVLITTAGAVTKFTWTRVIILKH